MKNNELIAKKFRDLRSELGFSQTQVANFLQIDQSYISKCEKNERNFTLDIIEKVATLFGCDLEYFLNEEIQYSPMPCAFRCDSIIKDKEDLDTIAAINKIALNLKFMKGTLLEVK